MPSPAPLPDAAVEVRGLVKSYREGRGERTVLDGVDWRVAAGELVVVLGRSGSGKSTLLNLLSGIDRPSAGEVWVGGRELSAMSERERTLYRRRAIGFVFQFFNLIPTLTVAENLLLPLELAGRSAPDDRRRAHDLLERVGLADRRQAFPDRLSGGEQQRVAVARALAHDPVLVLADEPTGNLDEDTGRRVLDLLDELTRRTGKTLVMVTHDRDASEVADRTFELAGGRIAPVGETGPAGDPAPATGRGG